MGADNNNSYLNDEKKEYRSPEIIEYGDLRSLTLGSSAVGFADSGDGGPKDYF